MACNIDQSVQIFIKRIYLLSYIMGPMLSVPITTNVVS